jgi:hypothetical protein
MLNQKNSSGMISIKKHGGPIKVKSIKAQHKKQNTMTTILDDYASLNSSMALSGIA